MANCSLPWVSFTGDIPQALLHFFIFYCCAICIVGIICNVVALWCVVSCSRTITSIKILLVALFLTTLLMCVVVMPFMVHMSFARLWCDREVSKTGSYVVILCYIAMTQSEIFYIFVMALLRALVVWSPQRKQIGNRTAILVGVGIALYNSSMTALVAAPFWRRMMPRLTRYIILKVFNAVHFLLPVLLTLACYLSTIVAVRRNKGHLASRRHTGFKGQVMDPATRAMLAVFISNLLLCVPHSIYHVIPYDYRVFSYVIMHSVFFTHLFVDPLVFLCFNQHHRRRVMLTFNTLLGRSPHVEAASPPTSQVMQSSSIQKCIEEGEEKALPNQVLLST